MQRKTEDSFREKDNFGRSDVAIFVPTYARNEHLCNLLIRILTYTWPNHPEVWFFSDATETILEHDNVIRTDSANWLDILRGGLKEVTKRQNDITTVFLILDDLLPIAPVHEQFVNKILEIFINRDLNYVAFNAYQALWRDKKCLDGEIFYRMPETFTHPCQLQPAIWKVCHLLHVCDDAKNLNSETPWAFERLEVNVTHYVSSYNWPTVFNGLFNEGYVNLNALQKIDVEIGGSLRNFLIRRSISDLPRKLTNRVYDKLYRLFRN